MVNEEKKLGYDGIMELMDRLARNAELREREAERWREEAELRDREAELSHKAEMERLDKESERRREEAELSHKAEMERLDKESERRREEAELSHKAEMERLDKESERREREAERQRAEAEGRRAEAERSHKEAMERLDKLEKYYGGVSENIGKHAEEFFQNALSKTLVFGGVKYDKLIPNLGVKKNRSCEFDMALVNCDSVALVEAKNRIHPKVVSVLATEKLEQFRKFFPEYANYRVYLGVAGFSFDDAVASEAAKYGVGLVRQDGDSVEEDAGELKVY